jgi:hypothetical protein
MLKHQVILCSEQDMKVLFWYVIQKVPNDVEAQRLLGEVQYEAGNYEASATAYRSSIRVNFLLWSTSLPDAILRQGPGINVTQHFALKLQSKLHAFLAWARLWFAKWLIPCLLVSRACVWLSGFTKGVIATTAGAN